MKKFLITLSMIFVIALSITLTGCNNKEKLYILNWDEYVDEDLLAAFEDEYNVNVVYETALSNETMYNKIVTDAAPYDLMVPSDYMISQLKNEDLIYELDFSKLSNYIEGMFDDTLETLLNSDACLDYKNYTVPYFWGSLGIMYNTEKLSEAEQQVIIENGWAVLFDNTLLPNKKVGMYESSRDCIAAAELYLGYGLNTTDLNELNKVQTALTNFKYSMWGTDGLKESVASGSLDYAIVYSGDFFDMLYSKYEDSDEPVIDFEMYCPKESNNVFFDGMVIPKTSQNIDLAYEFINFMIDHENSLQNARYVGYCPTITSVYEEMLNDSDFEGIVDNDAYYPGDITGGEVYKYLGAEIYKKFDDIFTAVKSK